MPATNETYEQLLSAAAELLYDASDTPRIDAEVLMQYAIDQPMSWLIAYGDTFATAQHTKRFFNAIVARQSGTPIAYITGERDFWTLNLTVNENVLIPRPDTETLVEQALNRLPANHDSQILDLGTGSGAIALALAKERPQACVTAVDVHETALSVASVNAARNNIDNTRFVLSHWFDAIAQDTKFDLIAANPPYVDANDPHLEQGDLRFEPNTALISDDDGLADLRTIISTAKHYLRDSGWLIVEHGFNQRHSVQRLFEESGFNEIECYQDINDLPRCTEGQYQ